MPFHPTCFEIYIRASRLRAGGIDVNGLAGWHRQQSDYESNWKFSRRYPAVVRGREQSWNHYRGDEWLAANPVLIPGLPSFLHSTLRQSQSSVEKYPTQKDPFAKLPRELNDAVFKLLSPVDIASLRLASYATHLPLVHWRQVIQEDMPWLWEIWDKEKPSFWVTTSFSALKAEQKRKEETEEQRQRYRTVIGEDMPEIWDIMCQDRPWLTEEYAVGPGASYANLGDSVPDLSAITSAEGINWCRLYYELKSHWEELKGLKNRQRIWEDVEEILRRIGKYREEGKIVD